MRRDRGTTRHSAKRVRANGLLHLLKTGKTRFAKVQAAMRDGHVVLARGGRESSKKGKFPSMAQQAHAHPTTTAHAIGTRERDDGAEQGSNRAGANGGSEG
ncbi:hypothetical protein EON65_33885 [archaeon]|nr:MAG: hypothetical protein EON65_33885 [archaeon]